MKINDKEMQRFFSRLSSDEYLKEYAGVDKQSQTIPFRIVNKLNLYKYRENLRILYTEEECEEIINILSDVYHILSFYFGIPALEDLLLSNYTDIEWGILIDHNFEKGQRAIKRDHFKHQFRNIYLGCVLLYEYNLIDRILSMRGSDSDFCAYIQHCIEKIAEETSKKIDEATAFKEVVFKAYFIAALFHDIGYPISHYIKQSQRMQNYHPFYHVVNADAKVPYAEIKSCLKGTLLFNSKNDSELVKKYNENDHGFYSAISFLMSFYLNGNIYSLALKDRCAIELAAVAMYNHTNEDASEGEAKMLFSNDPVSFLLRLCDDLQEWERFSIKIDENHNNMICDCINTIQPTEENDKIYYCECKKTHFEKITGIRYKKLNYLSCCDEIVIDSEDNETISVSLQYDKMKQLEICLLDFNAAGYRTNDLNKIRKMVKNQEKLPQIFIKFELSNNPYYLCKWILEEKGIFVHEIDKGFLKAKIPSADDELIDSFIYDMRNIPLRNEGEVIVDRIECYGDIEGFIKKYIGLIYKINMLN